MQLSSVWSKLLSLFFLYIKEPLPLFLLFPPNKKISCAPLSVKHLIMCDYNTAKITNGYFLKYRSLDFRNICLLGPTRIYIIGCVITAELCCDKYWQYLGYWLPHGLVVQPNDRQILFTKWWRHDVCMIQDSHFVTSYFLNLGFPRIENWKILVVTILVTLSVINAKVEEELLCQ